MTEIFLDLNGKVIRQMKQRHDSLLNSSFVFPLSCNLASFRLS